MLKSFTKKPSPLQYPSIFFRDTENSEIRWGLNNDWRIKPHNVWNLFDRQRPGHQFATALSERSDEPIVKALIPDHSGIFLFRFSASFFLRNRRRKYTLKANTIINDTTPVPTISVTGNSIQTSLFAWQWSHTSKTNPTMQLTLKSLVRGSRRTKRL